MLTARHTADEDTDDDAGGLYLPDGPDACFDSAEEAVDNLVERLTRILRELDECEDDTTTDPCSRCAPCRAYESVYVAVRALADREIDPENGPENGYVCAIAVDPEAPVTYRIARIDGGQCDENNHR